MPNLSNIFHHFEILALSLTIFQKKYWKSFLSLIFPTLCAECDRVLMGDEELLCLHCKMNLPVTNHHLDASNPILLQLGNAASVDFAFSYLKYGKKNITRQLIHDLKFRDKPNAGFVLGRWFAEHIEEYVRQERIEIIVPIPLHFSRWLKRGYNQSEIVSRGMNEILRLPINNFSLRRRKQSKSQAKRDKLDRWQSAMGTYYIHKPESLRGKRVLLVDDVITTGATITAAVETLKNAGVAYVAIACLATGKT